jgi:predicted ATPase
VAARCHSAIPAWHIGEVELAARLEREALAAAAGLGHANTLGYAFFYAGVLAAFRRRDHAALGDWAERLCAHAQEKAMPQWAAWGTCFGAPALTARGRPGEALARLRRGVAMCDAISNRAFRPAYDLFRAEALLASGDAGRALEAVEDGLRAADRGGEAWLDSELLRLRGEAALRLPGGGRAGEAEAAFRAAAESAERRGDRMFGLRALTGLARLLRDRWPRRRGARAARAVYASFTEGFAFPDLVEARALLEELGAAPAGGAGSCQEEPRAPAGPVHLRAPVSGR